MMDSSGNFLVISNNVRNFQIYFELHIPKRPSNLKCFVIWCFQKFHIYLPEQSKISQLRLFMYSWIHQLNHHYFVRTLYLWLKYFMKQIKYLRQVLRWIEISKHSEIITQPNFVRAIKVNTETNISRLRMTIENIW